MGPMCVQLRLLVGDEEVEEYLFPQGPCVAQMTKGEDGIPVIRRTDREDSRSHNTLALFDYNYPSLVLEPFDSVVVDAPTTRFATKDQDSRAVAIPASMHYKQNFIYLRPQDTITFQNGGLRVDVAFVEENLTEPTPLAQMVDSTTIDNDDDATVQVKSSNAGPETSVVNHEHEMNAGSDYGDDMVPLPAFRDAPIPHAIETTPVKSRSAEVTIKETPKHENDSMDNEDAFQYSTAPNEQDESVSYNGRTFSNPLLSAAESPLAKERITASRYEFEDTSASETPSELANGTRASAAGNLAEDDVFSPREKVPITYSKRRSRHTITPKAPKKNHTLGQEEKPMKTDSRSPSDVTNPDLADNNAEEANALTSEIGSTHGLAREAAVRTMSNASAKRKLSEQEESLEEEVMSPTKKQRTEEPSSNSSPKTAADDEEMQLYDVPESDEESAPSSGLRRRSRKSTPVARSTQGSSEEIIIATRKTSPMRVAKKRRSSPKVIIQKARKDETPVTDSDTSSNLSGKIPKILLSTESAEKTLPATKAWLKKIGATIVGKVPSRRSYFVCVVPKDHSLKSAKVLHTLVMDQYVVTDNWLKESQKAEELQDPAKYLHKTLEKDREVKRSGLFSGKSLFFTDSLMKNYKDGWKDIQDVAKAAGAEEVEHIPFHRKSLLCDRDDIIFFGNQKGDPEASRLVKDFGCTVYSKEFFTDSIISGSLDRQKDDHKLTVGAVSKRGRLS